MSGSGEGGTPETVVRITQTELARRAGLERMRVRLLCMAGGFGALFGAVSLKLAMATVLHPMAPAPRQIAPQVPRLPAGHADPNGLLADDMGLVHVHRATITDRNGQILAISLPLATVYANPLEIMDPRAAAEKLHGILPELDVADVAQRLTSRKQFVYIQRDIPPDKEVAINDLGIPGIYFEPSEKRHYPLGRVAAQIMGAVDIDDRGVAGVERYFDKRLTSDPHPLRLSLDVRVQAVVRDVLKAAKDEFRAIGACGIVMDVNTGEIIAMVSLPDYDANDFGRASDDQRFDRAVTGMYEPGSTFKLQTAAMALQDGVAHVWDRFSTRPIHVGRYTITDMKTDHFAPWLALPAVMAYSSNPAAAHIALDVGAHRQRDWLRNMGFFGRVPVELPEAGLPIVPPLRSWGLSTVMTVGFGHGVAEPPLAIVRGTAAAANGGILVRPTLLARDDDAAVARDDGSAENIHTVSASLPLGQADIQPDGAAEMVPDGPRLISPANSRLLREMLRLVVTKGIGSRADVPGYFVGGKTGTAEKIGPRGGYLKHVNIAAFTGIFPMNSPRYAVYVMLDSPVGNKETHGWTTAGWVAAPQVSRIVARIGPMLGLFPQSDRQAEIDASLAIPLEPAPPPGVRPLGPDNDPGDPRDMQRPRHQHGREPLREAAGREPTPREAEHLRVPVAARRSLLYPAVSLPPPRPVPGTAAQLGTSYEPGDATR